MYHCYRLLCCNEYRRLRDLANIGGGFAFIQTCSNEPTDNMSTWFYVLAGDYGDK